MLQGCLFLESIRDKRKNNTFANPLNLYGMGVDLIYTSCPSIYTLYIYISTYSSNTEAGSAAAADSTCYHDHNKVPNCSVLHYDLILQFTSFVCNKLPPQKKKNTQKIIYKNL